MAPMLWVQNLLLGIAARALQLVHETIFPAADNDWQRP
jgi:hypothetical protein